jgi:hypothetical protein
MFYPLPMKRTSIQVLACLFAFSVFGEDSKFATVILPLGVSVKVPKNWRILDGDANTTIETATEAQLNLSKIDLPTRKKLNLFRANSNPPTTYASIAINATDSEIQPSELTSATDAELKDFGKVFESKTKQMLAGVKLELLRFDGARRETIGGEPALVLEYLRSGTQGPVFVQMTRLFVGSKEIGINLSYRESEGTIWRPIVSYMRQSLSVTTASRDGGIVFAPRISDYAVTFSGKPTVQDFEVINSDGSPIKGVRAEFRAEDSFQRIEVMAMPPGFSSSETKESAIAKMTAYAKHNGLSSPEFTWEVTAIGKRLTMRATKLLDDNGKAVGVTYAAIVYYGHSSLFTAYVGGPSDSYPSARVVKFLKSVSKNENR